MLIHTDFFILASCIYILVQCEIPNLNVRKIDRQLIAKKRQDTLDMCRIFTEENAKIQQSKPKIIDSYKNFRKTFSRRQKRHAGNPAEEAMDHGVSVKKMLHIKPDNIRQKRNADNPAQTARFFDHDASAQRAHNHKLENVKRHKRDAMATKDKDTILGIKKFYARRALALQRFTQKPERTKRQKRDTEDHQQNDVHKSAKVNQDVHKKFSVNPALSPDGANKIESIVEKLYDDMEENGNKVSYKRNPDVTSTTTTTTTMTPKNVSEKSPSRRLYFAPKLLTGPVPEKFRSRNDTGVYDKARWRHGIIPYFIDSKTYDAQLQEIIMKAFDYIEKATCIRLQKLRERPTDRKSLQEVDWVYISNPSGVRQCVHSNEKRKIDGVQMSVLGYDCMSMGDIVHEVMHILGFSHEHTRSDRDQHISIMWDNIKPGYKKYFEIATVVDQYTLENLPYDHASILHYPPRAFSKNGQLTIMTEPGIKIGQREGLSEIDLEKVGTIYAGECVERNKEYLLKTCPSVVKAETEPAKVTQQEIEDYFKERLWPYGLISYKLRDDMEFSTEEKSNIYAVIEHIEKETCIKFRDISSNVGDPVEGEEDEGPPEDNVVMEEDVTEDPKDSENIEGRRRMNPSTQKIDNTPESGVLRNAAENEINTDEKRSGVKAEGTGNSSRIRRQVAKTPKPQRRHANSVLILTRTAVPGCKCPSPGKPSGNAVLEINADCFNSVNDLLHLFVHVLGLDHQHNMHDRDNYLHIMWNNLTPEVKQELKETLPPAASAGFPYDYQSVMHYPWLQIKNGVTNMMYPIWNDGWAMGHWQGLSSFDVQKLNLLYFDQCSERQKQSHQ